MTGWRTLHGTAPDIIAHRGASGLLPEHTLAGYALALQQGSDVIEPDLLPSADDVLYCRHDLGLARSTDVATRSEFATLAADGDWPITAFRAGQLDRLRARQPFPARGTAEDGRHALPRFSAMIDWAAEASRSLGRPVLLYPEIKHPQLLADAGHDPLPRFIEMVRSLPAGVVLRVQCFDVVALRRLHDATGLRCTLLLDAKADWRRAIAEHGGWLAALGVDKHLLYGAHGDSSGLVEQAHASGLRVDAWTFRDDQPDAAFPGVAEELRAAMQGGVDGLFCDFPATALALRDSGPFGS